MSGAICKVKFSRKDKKVLKWYGRQDILELHNTFISKERYDRIEKQLKKYYKLYAEGDKIGLIG